MYGLRLRFKKFRIVIFMLVSSLFSVFLCRPAWAASEVSPLVYIFNVASYACGMAPAQHPTFWLDAYKGYLEYTNNTAALNQLKYFESLSWGDTVTGMDLFTKDLKSFFANYVDYQGEWVPAFKFPCKKRVYSGFITDTEDCRISSTSYSDVFSSVPSGYRYLYSDWYAVKETSGVNAGRIYNVKRNFFVPTGSEIVGMYSVGFYDKSASIRFYRWDSANSKVSDPIKLKYSSTSYWVDTGECFSKDSSVSNEVSNGYFRACDMINFPVKVFSHTDHMKNYFSNNGKPYVYSSSSECVLFNSTASYGEYIKEPLAYVSASIILPSNSSSADSALKGVLNGCYTHMDSIYNYSKLLSDYTSLTIGYPYEYIINYMYDGVLDGTDTGIASTHDLMVSSVKLKPKTGYHLAPIPYTPSLPAMISSESNTITVNYESWEYPYTVEYYYDGVLDGTKKFTVPSYDNTVSSVPLVGRTGYRLAADSYDPVLPTDIDDTNNVIKVNYESWEYPYTVEYYYDGVLGQTKQFTVPSYSNTVSEVLLAPKTGYRLSDSGYAPALPAVIDDSNNVVKVYYESWEYPYRVEYYYDGVLGQTKQFTVPSYSNTVSEVLLAPKTGYRLSDPGYAPALPAVIDDTSNVIKVNYESWEYPYTVEYYYDDTLGDTKQFTVPSYANTVTEVPEIGKKGYKLTDSPYAPALPAVIDDQNHVIKVFYKSWNYIYTVKYYFGSTLKEKRRFFIPSYDNVVKKVPLIDSGVFVFSSYAPQLPAVIDDNNNVIEVHYVSPAALAVSNEVNGTIAHVKKVILSVIPALLLIICTVFMTIFLVRWFKRISEKG